MKRLVGLHLRYKQSPFELLEKAERLELTIAQFFLHNEQGDHLRLQQNDYAEFKRRATQQFKQLVAHGSYAINLASPQRTHHPALTRELLCAEQLGCTHFLLHPGSAPSLADGIDALARMINTISKKLYGIQLVLENTAFAAPSIGGTFDHFGDLLGKLDQPDNIHFCIDTAHAYAAGYDLAHNQSAFVELITKTVGVNRIALIHANDTTAPCGGSIDIHCMPGKGLIGLQGLQTFVLNRQLARIPLIVELPSCDEQEERQALSIVRSWNQV